MTNIRIRFDYNNNNIELQVNENDTLEIMINKCLTKLNKKKNEIFFLIVGIAINDENMKDSVKKYADKEDNTINGIIYDYDDVEEKKIIKKSKQIICPECKENCLINFKDYKLNLNNCDKKHIKENILLKNFNDLQIIDESLILCKNCFKSKEDVTDNLMYYCCNCNINLCLLCKLNHSKNNGDHQLIDYDFKNYLCYKHGEKFISYCINCNKNLCDICEIEDKKQNHKFIHYSDIVKDKDDNNIKDLRLKIDKLKDEKKNIKDDLLSQDIFNKVIENLEIYYDISNNIFINYSIRNKNYQLLMNFININNYNKAVIEDIDKIINEQNIENKVKSIMDIYNKTEKFDEFVIKYKIGGEYKIRIFGDKFVKNNKTNCKLIINDKITGLKKEVRRKDLNIKNDNIFEIKLKLVNDIKDLSYIFEECSSLLFPDIVNLDTTNITDMSFMFSQCKSLTSIPDISNWNTKNVKKMNNLFSYCESLTSLPDISNWNTNNVTDMSGIFLECKKLESLPDISKWNTNNVTDMSSLFQNCYALSILPDISKWNTSNVTDMSNIFYKCIELKTLPDISKWDVSKVNNMENMFRGCSSLTTLPDLSKWKINKDINKKNMFSNCSKLSSLPAFAN